jgi:hypothetical protein
MVEEDQEEPWLNVVVRAKPQPPVAEVRLAFTVIVHLYLVLRLTAAPLLKNPMRDLMPLHQLSKLERKVDVTRPPPVGILLQINHMKLDEHTRRLLLSLSV